MGYKGSPTYVQRQTDAMLRPLRKFARAFVDDIVVFSHTLTEHLEHLNQLFSLLRAKNVSLAPTKSFLGYPSVMLLGQRVDSLGMTTAEEKIQAITALKFPRTLRELETFLGLTGWLRSSIPRYAQRAQPLQDRKTRLTQEILDVTPSSQGRLKNGLTKPGHPPPDLKGEGKLRNAPPKPENPPPGSGPNKALHMAPQSLSSTWPDSSSGRKTLSEIPRNLDTTLRDSRPEEEKPSNTPTPLSSPLPVSYPHRGELNIPPRTLGSTPSVFEMGGRFPKRISPEPPATPAASPGQSRASQHGSTSTHTNSPAPRQLSGPARKRLSSRLHYHPTQEELHSFHDLQDAFHSPTFLVHYDKHRQLYVDLDASKVWGVAAIIYHRLDDNDDRRTSVQPIIFLSRNINAAERNYWPTELEVAGIVWVVKKIRHMIDSTEKSPTIIYTDHSAAIPISRQTSLTTSSTDKLNLRLVRASQYLSSFNLAIRHKSGASNIVPDALSRLQGLPDLPVGEKADILDCLYGTAVPLSAAEHDAILPEVFTFHATLVEMTDGFKKRLEKAYTEDEQ